ncbi:MAG: hypothetical protein MUF38_17650 [Anaerolineae bacterium]|nr:hypothetical protein [Anaerolineae bacterium]
MSNEFGVLIHPKRNVIVADSQDADHAQSVNPNPSKRVRFAAPHSGGSKARHASLKVTTLLHHTANPLTVRRSEMKNTPRLLLEDPPRFHLASATHHGEKTSDTTTVSFEQARTVAKEMGYDWTRLDEVIACFVHARLLMSRERHERYEHAKPSKSE